MISYGEKGLSLPTLWLYAPMSTDPGVTGTHVSWDKDEDEEYKEYEHDGRSKEGEQYDNKDEYVLYQAQYSIEKTSGGEGGNESRD